MIEVPVLSLVTPLPVFVVVLLVVARRIVEPGVRLVGLAMFLVVVQIRTVGCVLLLEWVVTLKPVVVFLLIVLTRPVKKLVVTFVPVAIFLLVLLDRFIMMRSVAGIAEMLYFVLLNVWLLYYVSLRVGRALFDIVVFF